MIEFDRNNAPMWVDATDAEIARATSRRMILHPLMIVAMIAAFLIGLLF